MKAPLLLPAPKKCDVKPGVWKAARRGLISMSPNPVCELLVGEELRDDMASAGDWRLARSLAPSEAPNEIRLRPDPTVVHPQGYRLRIDADGVEIRAGHAAGMRYGSITLRQLLWQYRGALPFIEIDDEPDFERRAVYHDVSRGKVPTRETLLGLIGRLSDLKINEFQLYVENVFEFRRHPDMYSDTTPLTAEDMLILDNFCRERHIDFVPSLTSLGHFDKILKRPQYRALAEAEPEDLRKAGVSVWCDDPWTLCVTDPRAKVLLSEMYDEFLPNFSSELFNICCDESWDLGKGRSKAEADRVGVGRLYVNWVRFCHDLAAKHGKRIQLWGDIILNHPELIDQIPEDATLLEWGYEANHDFDGHGKLFADAGRRFYVCPGTSAWQTIAGRTKNAIGNLLNAAEAGRRHGAAGFMITDWGDQGHQQMLSISFVPFACGAAVAWNGERFDQSSFLRATSLHVFNDADLKIAGVVADLGNVGAMLDARGKPTFNGSAEFFLFREPLDADGRLKNVGPTQLRRAADALKQILARLGEFKPVNEAAQLAHVELALSAAMIMHVLTRTTLRLGLALDTEVANWAKALHDEITDTAETYAELWAARNRPSRLEDVMAHFERLRREYSALEKSAGEPTGAKSKKKSGNKNRKLKLGV